MRRKTNRWSPLAAAAGAMLSLSALGGATVTDGVKTPDAVKTVLWRNVPLAVGRNAVELKAGGRTETGEMNSSRMGMERSCAENGSLLKLARTVGCEIEGLLEPQGKEW